MIESGSCGGALISTTSECEAAATALDLSEKTAGGHIESISRYEPPGCQLYYSYLWVNNGGGYGSCSSYAKCICKSTSP